MSMKNLVAGYLIYKIHTDEWKGSFIKKAFVQQHSWLFFNVKIFLTAPPQKKQTLAKYMIKKSEWMKSVLLILPWFQVHKHDNTFMGAGSQTWSF